MHSVALVQSDVKVAKKGQMVDASFAIENNGGHDIKIYPSSVLFLMQQVLKRDGISGLFMIR